MIVDDRIYGRFEITQPVLIELMGAGTVVRLKDVSQRGYPAFVECSSPVHYSRYEHSIGCMLLLRKLGAGLEEQIAGLLHDVSHTAFSHTVDWAFGDPTREDYQDSILAQYINASPLAQILKRHGYDSSEISSLEETDRFGLMERKIPQLCADRIDYTLRDCHYSLGCDAGSFLDHLTVSVGHIAFDSYEMALKFGETYMRCQKELWGSQGNAVRYYIIGRMMKEAVESGVVSRKDLHLTETEFIDAVRRSGNEHVNSLMDLAFGHIDYKIANDGIRLNKKFRYVDPEFVQNGKNRRVSEVNPKYGKMLDDEGKIEREGFRAKISGLEWQKR
jgi:hypothetical protein